MLAARLDDDDDDIYTNMYTDIYKYIYTHIYIYIYIYTLACIYMHIHDILSHMYIPAHIHIDRSIDKRV